jgi:hypothetical protein
LTDALDMRDTIIPKSDQLNADDLIGGPMTVAITKVSRANTAEQPIAVNFNGDGGKPYFPCKSMRRVMVTVWGPNASAYVGRSMTLYRDPAVTWGGMEVGGIRISHMSHMEGPVTLALTATKKARKPYRVLPLATPEPVAAPEPPRRTVRQFLDDLDVELREASSWDEVAAIVARDDVRKAQDTFTNGASERLLDMISAAQERHMHPADGESVA